MSPFRCFLSSLHIATLDSWNQLILSTTQSATSAQRLRNLPIFPQHNQDTEYAMPRRKQFDLVEKTKILLWFHEGVTPKEIAERLQRNVKAVRKIIAANKDLLVHQKPPPPKKRYGRPRMTTAVQENRLRRYLTAHPFKTAKELKNEVAGWSHVSVRSI